MFSFWAPIAIEVPQNASSHVSRSDRITYAQNALGRVKENYQVTTGYFDGPYIIERQGGLLALTWMADLYYWQYPQVLASYAFKDYVTNTTDNHFVVDALKLAAADYRYPGFSGMV